MIDKKGERFGLPIPIEFKFNKDLQAGKNPFLYIDGYCFYVVSRHTNTHWRCKKYRALGLVMSIVRNILKTILYFNQIICIF